MRSAVFFFKMLISHAWPLNIASEQKSRFCSISGTCACLKEINDSEEFGRVTSKNGKHPRFLKTSL